MERTLTGAGRLRVRWSAIGAAVAVSLGAGGLGLVHADISSGAKPVTVTVAPKRVLDTRDDLGLADAFVDSTPRNLVVGGPVAVAPSGTETVIPADATGVIVNVTIVNPTGAGFLSLRPGGATGTPTSSTVNFTAAGAIVPNSATVALGVGATIQIWVETAANGGTADVLLDIVGYTTDHNHDDRYYTEAEVDVALSLVSGVDYSQNAAFIPVADAVTSVGSVAITAPAPGVVVVTASAFAIQAASGVSLRCGLSTSATVFEGDQSANQYVSSAAQFTVAMTKGFDVPAGTTTVYFLCRRDNAGADYSIGERNMTAVYSINRP